MSGIGVQKSARIRAVRAICRSRCIDDDARHDIQRRITGKASLSEMSLVELGQVLDHLNGKSTAGESSEWSFTFRMTTERRAHAKKIYRLAQRVGALMNPPRPVASKEYIEGIATRMCGAATRLEFCNADQLHKIVQALEIHLSRHGG